MATFTRLKSGSWRVQVRRKGTYVNDTFLRRKDAEEWALDMERRIDRQEPAISRKSRDARLFGDLVRLHRQDMQEVGKRIGRSKTASLAFLDRRLGGLRLRDLDRERLIEFGKERAREGAGPVTVAIDLGYIKTILSHAAAVHGVCVSTEPIDLARIALGRLGLVGKGEERDRRPTPEELTRIISTFEGNSRQQIPMARIVKFAVATAMRLDEICRVEWQDYDSRTRMLTIRDRKDPRRKKGNHQRIPLLDVSGYDACALIEEQRQFTKSNNGRIFPYNGRSVGTAFRRMCRDLKIEDLHFHDLRHEGTSRLFEAGFSIEQVALVTGHKDWKMLRRYTHLRPEDLHRRRRSHVAGPTDSKFESFGREG
ncbi:Site-specific recombinase, phage integrase family [Rhodovulum sp. PH10]|uniref:integrase n=1 Tax=Rhodovulum sp. PH10 TaxID=1187851 RepID=UPI00027C2D80|nr:site-specific integrase [Rhodovulum sp. PH10]EJW11553.1 Site-specific recombinase, phage integrase family [Rhodovulum sp. PH10]